ncbi:MAG TPA: diaminopropionate ammonia-lyase [Pseudogracilibacillus sp.]|nr:diaminopropionate ammonia-lyase [Pseudogracilibacillus sp.]
MKEIAFAENKLFESSHNEAELQYFNKEAIETVTKFQRSHPAYTKTPLRALSNFAELIGVKNVYVKDESSRFGLNAFKVLGGIYAIGKYMAERLGKDINELSFEQLQSDEVRAQIGQVTFISATDGNHGKGVAWAARELGQKAVIYLPKGSRQTRLDAVFAEGADGAITDKNYDETVQMCARLAEENDWVMVQDTAFEGYDEIPLWIMQGYATIAAETIEALETQGEAMPTHVFLQAGVGSFAAAITAYFQSYFGEKAPQVFVVEPHLANCYYESFKENRMETVGGAMNSIMAGLCCGAPNTRAYRILSQYATGTFSLDDKIAADGMRILGNPLASDERIITGESGAAVATGLLYHLHQNNQPLKEQLGLDDTAAILLINTEGDTDLAHYRQVVWTGKHG